MSQSRRALTCSSVNCEPRGLGRVPSAARPRPFAFTITEGPTLAPAAKAGACGSTPKAGRTGHVGRRIWKASLQSMLLGNLAVTKDPTARCCRPATIVAVGAHPPPFTKGLRLARAAAVTRGALWPEPLDTLRCTPGGGSLGSGHRRVRLHDGAVHGISVRPGITFDGLGWSLRMTLSIPAVSQMRGGAK